MDLGPKSCAIAVTTMNKDGNSNDNITRIATSLIRIITITALTTMTSMTIKAMTRLQQCQHTKLQWQ